MFDRLITAFVDALIPLAPNLAVALASFLVAWLAHKRAVVVAAHNSLKRTRQESPELDETMGIEIAAEKMAGTFVGRSMPYTRRKREVEHALKQESLRPPKP